MSPPVDVERRRRLIELADWHHEWAMRRVDRAPFDPSGRKDGSDYNQHFVDVDDDDDDFHERAREIMGIAS